MRGDALLIALPSHNALTPCASTASPFDFSAVPPLLGPPNNSSHIAPSPFASVSSSSAALSVRNHCLLKLSYKKIRAKISEVWMTKKRG